MPAAMRDSAESMPNTIAACGISVVLGRAFSRIGPAIRHFVRSHRVRPKSAIALLSILAFAGGCASTASIEQGKNLSASGIAYSDAVYALIDVSIDKVIDFDSVELRKGRFYPINPPDDGLKS
jgi:hypothetical protein